MQFGVDSNDHRDPNNRGENSKSDGSQTIADKLNKRNLT
jgi:hypothetical protein